MNEWMSEWTNRQVNERRKEGMCCLCWRLYDHSLIVLDTGIRPVPFWVCVLFLSLRCPAGSPDTPPASALGELTPIPIAEGTLFPGLATSFDLRVKAGVPGCILPDSAVVLLQVPPPRRCTWAGAGSEGAPLFSPNFTSILHSHSRCDGKPLLDC